MSKQDWIIGGILGLAMAAVVAVFGVSQRPTGGTAENTAPNAPAAQFDYQRDYLRTVYGPLHFKPAAEAATDEQCLACHREVLVDKVRATSPAGVPTQETRAWYQQLATYAGDQDTFHRRHLATPLAKQLMNLQCNTCHQGHEPREEAPGSSASADQATTDITLRKQVNPETVCLKCHGQMPANEIMGLPGPWPEVKDTFQNNCLLCHANIRTNRHNVNYLNAAAIETLAQEKGGDVCYGCHGGRAWYRIAYPYPRHPWPEMAPDVPEWAKDRPTHSEPRFAKSANLNRYLQPTP
jgi:nitrate/TMAO reductase-like tetraheme cytochrome c subunit